MIYFWAAPRETLLMLTIYAKTEQDDLSPSQVKVLRKVVKEEYR